MAFGEIWGPGDCCAADSGYRTRDDLPGPSPAPPLPPGVSPPPPITVQGLPIVKPPYGMISAIDVNRGLEAPARRREITHSHLGSAEHLVVLT